MLRDGRCDSLAYNAKYSIYTFQDKNSGFILDFHVSHVRIAGNSARMLDGLKNVLKRLEDYHLSIKSLTIDRKKTNLDFNADVWVSQANTRYKQQFSKMTKSWVVKKIALKKNT